MIETFYELDYISKSEWKKKVSLNTCRHGYRHDGDTIFGCRL